MCFKKSTFNGFPSVPFLAPNKTFFKCIFWILESSKIASFSKFVEKYKIDPLQRTDASPAVFSAGCRSAKKKIFSPCNCHHIVPCQRGEGRRQTQLFVQICTLDNHYFEKKLNFFSLPIMHLYFYIYRGSEIKGLGIYRT